MFTIELKLKLRSPSFTYENIDDTAIKNGVYMMIQGEKTMFFPLDNIEYIIEEVCQPSHAQL